MTARLLVTLSLMALVTGCPDDLTAGGSIADQNFEALANGYRNLEARVRTIGAGLFL